MSDLDALLALEHAVFTPIILSRRSFRHFLASPNAALIVAEHDSKLAGYALVLYPPRSDARPPLFHRRRPPRWPARGRAAAAGGGGARRRSAGAARRCGSKSTSTNTRAIARYEKSGYRLFGRHRDYYDDRDDALRFEKPLDRNLTAPTGRCSEARLTPRRELVFMVAYRRAAQSPIVSTPGYDVLVPCLISNA